MQILTQRGGYITVTPFSVTKLLFMLWIMENLMIKNN